MWWQSSNLPGKAWIDDISAHGPSEATIPGLVLSCFVHTICHTFVLPREASNNSRVLPRMNCLLQFLKPDMTERGTKMAFRLASVLSSPGLILPENTSKHSPKEGLPVSQSLKFNYTLLGMYCQYNC